MVIIHNAKIEDLENLGELLKIKEISWRGEGYSIEYFKRLVREGVILVAEIDSKIVGFVFGEFSKEEDWAELTGVAVLEEHRGKGIGSKLINEFENVIRGKKISSIEVNAHVETLAKFIHKFGYEKGESYINCKKKL